MAMVEEESYAFSAVPSLVVGLGKKIQERKDLADFQLIYRETVIHVHKAVVAVQSEYLSTIIKSKFKESRDCTIDLSNAIGSLEALNQILRFMYTGEIDITTSSVEDILSTASYFMVKDVEKACASVLLKTLCLENCFRYLRLAEIYDFKDLYDIAFDFVQCRFKDNLAHSESILELPKEFMEDLTKKGALKFMKLPEICMMLLRWLNHCPEERLASCIEIIKSIDVSEIRNESLEFLQAKLDEKQTSLEVLNLELSNRANLMPQLSKMPQKCILFYQTGQSVYSGQTDHHLWLYLPDFDQWYSCKKDIGKHLPSGFENVGFWKDSLVYRRSMKLFLLSLKPDTQNRELKLQVNSGQVTTFDGDLIHVRMDGPKISIYMADPVKLTWKRQATETVAKTPDEEHRKWDKEKPQLYLCPTADMLMVCYVYGQKMTAIGIIKQDDKYVIDIDTDPTYIPYDIKDKDKTDLDKTKVQVYCNTMIVTKSKGTSFYNISGKKWIKHDQNTKITAPLLPSPKLLKLEGEPSMIHIIESHLNVMQNFEPIQKQYDMGFIARSAPISRPLPHPGRPSRMWLGATYFEDQLNAVWQEVSPPPIKWDKTYNVHFLLVPTSVLQLFTCYTMTPLGMEHSCPYRFAKLDENEQCLIKEGPLNFVSDNKDYGEDYFGCC